MRKDCDTCLHDEFGEKYCNDCYWANGKPPTKWEPAPFWTPDTNADRIRAMTDEELADLLTSANKGAITDICRKKHYEHNLQWLRQPADQPE